MKGPCGLEDCDCGHTIEKLEKTDIRPKLPWRCSGCGADPQNVKWCAIASPYWNGHVIAGSIPDVCGPFVFTAHELVRAFASVEAERRLKEKS